VPPFVLPTHTYASPIYSRPIRPHAPCAKLRLRWLRSRNLFRSACEVTLAAPPSGLIFSSSAVALPRRTNARPTLVGSHPALVQRRGGRQETHQRQGGDSRGLPFQTREDFVTPLNSTASSSRAIAFALGCLRRTLRGVLRLALLRNNASAAIIRHHDHELLPFLFSRVVGSNVFKFYHVTFGSTDF